MPKISIFGSLTNIQMVIQTFFKGSRVGRDAVGNVYYRGRPRRGTKQERRWVIYQDGHEASTVPAEWHGWLHRQTDLVPPGESRFRKIWQLPPKANLTGTDGAYLPPALKTGKRDPATGDYVSWQPPQ